MCVFLYFTASDDNTLGIWSTSTGLRVGTLGIHLTILNMAGALNLSQVVLQIANQNVVPFLKLHNNPTKGMVLDLPPGTPVTEEAKTPGNKKNSFPCCAYTINLKILPNKGYKRIKTAI